MYLFGSLSCIISNNLHTHKKTLIIGIYNNELGLVSSKSNEHDDEAFTEKKKNKKEKEETI